MRDLRRFFASRLLRTGLLFLFLVGAPSVGGAYRCCSTGDHDGGHRARAGLAAANDAHGAHAMHMGAPSVQHHAPTPDEHQAPGNAPCTCVGHCCAAPVLALGAAGVQLPAESPLVATRASIEEREHRLDSRDAHLLPFGNAPPAPLAS